MGQPFDEDSNGARPRARPPLACLDELAMLARFWHDRLDALKYLLEDGDEIARESDQPETD